jgi:uncharacterized membrane protein YkoI
MRNLIKLMALIFLFSHAVCAGSEISLARLTLDEATKKVISGSNKRVLGAQTEIIDGREVHVIKVLTPDGRIQHYLIDAETGELIG